MVAKKGLLEMNEEELKAKEAELEAKEGELKSKEEELNAKEAELAKRETDAANIAKALKEEFEKKIEAQRQDFEARLQQRDEVIRQLANGETTETDENSPFAKLNKRRLAQKAA